MALVNTITVQTIYIDYSQVKQLVTNRTIKPISLQPCHFDGFSTIFRKENVSFGQPQPQSTLGRLMANQGSLVPLSGSQGSLVATLDGIFGLIGIVSLSPLSEARACNELFRPRYHHLVVQSFLYVGLERGVGFSLDAFGQVGVLCLPSSVMEYFFFSGVFYFIPFILLLCRRNLSRAEAMWIC